MGTLWWVATEGTLFSPLSRSQAASAGGAATSGGASTGRKAYLMSEAIRSHQRHSEALRGNHRRTESVLSLGEAIGGKDDDDSVSLEVVACASHPERRRPVRGRVRHFGVVQALGDGESEVLHLGAISDALVRKQLRLDTALDMALDRARRRVLVREPRVDRRAHLGLGVKRGVNGGRVTRGGSPDNLAQHRENLEDAFEFALMKVASAIKDN